MSLEYEIQLPDDPRDGAPLIVLLHGRGSDRFDLLGLRPGLPSNAIVVTPQAPFQGTQWGYGPGWAWYRFLGEDQPEPETFVESQTLLEEFLDALPDSLPVRPGHLVLGGFSQGGTMSLAHALRRPGEIPAVINYSGFLANHPSVSATPESVRGTRIFWGHGVHDGMITIGLAERGRARLREAGADLTALDYPIGHAISQEEIAATRQWIEQGAGDLLSNEGQ